METAENSGVCNCWESQHWTWFPVKSTKRSGSDVDWLTVLSVNQWQAVGLLENAWEISCVCCEWAVENPLSHHDLGRSLCIWHLRYAMSCINYTAFDFLLCTERAQSFFPQVRGTAADVNEIFAYIRMVAFGPAGQCLVV